MLATTDGSIDTVKIDQVINYTRFSQYSHLIRATAQVFQFLKACQKQRSEDHNLQLSATELNNAERCWIRCLQVQCFEKEIKSILRKSKPGEIHVNQFGLMWTMEF